MLYNYTDKLQQIVPRYLPPSVARCFDVNMVLGSTVVISVWRVAGKFLDRFTLLHGIVHFRFDTNVINSFTKNARVALGRSATLTWPGDPLQPIYHHIQRTLVLKVLTAYIFMQNSRKSTQSTKSKELRPKIPIKTPFWR